MILEIVTENKSVDVFSLEPQEIWPERKVFIDGKPVPPGLAKIILLGTDVATDQYCDYIKEMMKEGHYWGDIKI